MNKTKAVTRPRATTNDKKLDACYTLLDIRLKKNAYNTPEAKARKKVADLLAIGEMVIVKHETGTYGVKNSPTHIKQASQALLKEAKRITKWKALQKEADRLRRQLDGVEDAINEIERGCLVDVEVGSSIKTIKNPKVD